MLFHLNLTIMAIISALTHTTLFNNQFGNSENNLLDKSLQWFSGCSCCVETGHLICRAYRLTGFYTVGMTTNRVFRAGYTISFFVSLTLSLFGFLRLLLIIFKYLVYLVFFVNFFSVLRIVLFKWAGVSSILPVVTLEWCSLMLLHGHYGCSWTSLCLLESPSFSKMPVNLIQYRGAVGVLTIDTLLVN